MCVSGNWLRKELQHSAHVLDKPREFVKIFRHREVEFCHALDVLLREARGRVGRLELHLHKGAGVIRGFSPDRCCSGERLGTATEEAEGPGRSGVSAVKEAVRIAAQKPMGMNASRPLVFLKKWWMWFCT
ncbi:hypothetical protein MHU86_10121 [Fragilaria crotonensis]|nr:hypothetical protein MHU86_10121 [Fragilaria crotonensis]